MKKVLFFVVMLMTTNCGADTGCERSYQHIQTMSHNLNMLLQGISLLRLDIQSFNADQQELWEYQQLMVEYNTRVENYDAIASNHNQTIKQYQTLCEN